MTFGPELAAILADAHPAADGKGLVVGFTGQQAYYHMRRAVERASLGPDVTPHILRHTSGTTMIDSASPLAASRMPGHSDTGITERHYSPASGTGRPGHQCAVAASLGATIRRWLQARAGRWLGWSMWLASHVRIGWLRRM